MVRCFRVLSGLVMPGFALADGNIASMAQPTLKTLRSALILPAFLLLGTLAGCAEPAEQAAAPAPAKIPPQDFPPGTVAELPTPEGVHLVNDPSAPADTPLCGVSVKEANAMSAVMYPQPLTPANACAQNACFNPATNTYIALDGSKRVCR